MNKDIKDEWGVDEITETMNGVEVVEAKLVKELLREATENALERYKKTFKDLANYDKGQEGANAP